MTRLVRLGKAALALVLLAVLIVAAPVVLASFGNPIGDAVDTFADQLASDATRTEAVLVAVLATVGWVCWAMVLTALLTETVAAVRGTVARPLPLLLPGIQPTVRALLSAVTVASTALPAGASPSLPPPPVLAVADGHDLASQPADPEPAAAPAETVAPVGPVYVVERGDTWWSIAETVLGAGTRWAEVVAANDGHTMPDGTTLTVDTARPRPGWTLALPPAAVLPLQTAPEPDPPAGQVHLVEAGDSLWDIAESYVADDSNQAVVDAVEVIAQANNLADPNVISVGQPLAIPNMLTDPHDGPAGGPAGSVVVEPGDTLWGLAAEYLGDGHRYHDIVDLNAGRPQPDDQHRAAGSGARDRPAQFERIPARQQRVDLEAPGQPEHVLQRAGLDLRDVDRFLLLVDAGLHAVVADAVAGRGDQRIVDRRHRQLHALFVRHFRLAEYLIEPCLEFVPPT